MRVLKTNPIIEQITIDNNLITADNNLITADNNTMIHYKLRVIPRYFVSNVVMRLKEELTRVESVFNIDTINDKGIMEIRFLKTFKEGEAYEIYIYDVEKIIWRGNLYITDQDDLTNFSINSKNDIIII